MQGVTLFASVAVVACLVACREPATPPGPKADPVVLSTEDGGSYEEPFDAPSGYRHPGCAKACANLRLRGCPEGVTIVGEDSCYVVCRRAEETGKIDFETACIAQGETQDAIRACGTYRCQ